MKLKRKNISSLFTEFHVFKQKPSRFDLYYCIKKLTKKIFFFFCFLTGIFKKKLGHLNLIFFSDFKRFYLRFQNKLFGNYSQAQRTF